MSNSEHENKKPNPLFLGITICISVMTSVNTVVSAAKNGTEIYRIIEFTPGLLQRLEACRVSVSANNSETLNNSETQRQNVVEAKAIMSEFEHCISNAIRELRQSNEKQASEVGTQILKQEEIGEEAAAYENYLKFLETELKRLKEVQTLIDGSRKAAEWLDPETKKEELKRLALEVGNLALGVASDSPEQQFHKNIRGYLYAIYKCLDMCKPNFLEIVLEQNEIPLGDIPAATYERAFSLIEARIPGNIRDDKAAANQLTYYLTYIKHTFASPTSE